MTHYVTTRSLHYEVLYDKNIVIYDSQHVYT